MNTTCLICFDGLSPYARGMTEDEAAGGVEVNPLLASTVLLKRGKLAHTASRSIAWTVPNRRLPMYEALVPSWLASTSTPFGPAPRPLALATNSRFPSPLRATAEGYQPVGSRPLTRPERGSTRATELRPPSAT